MFSRVVSALALALLLSACAAGDPEADDAEPTGPSIVVTTNILGDVVTDLVGNDGSVEVLMPIGADPHDFELSARQTGRLREADLVIANGLRLEEGMIDALEAAEADGAVVVEVAELVDPIAFSGSDHDHEESEHEALDPHFWLDPVRMAEGVRIIGHHIGEQDDTGDVTVWEERAETLATEIERTHGEFAASLATIPEGRRSLVTNHDSLGYFAARYDFEVLATVIPGGSTLGEATAGDLAQLVAVIETEGVPAIFTDVTDTSGLSATLAAEVDEEIEVVSLYTGSLGEPDSDGDTYLNMMESNVNRIVTALGEG